MRQRGGVLVFINNAITRKQKEIHMVLKKLVDGQKGLKKERVRIKKDRPKK